jgi:hypothetical protein
MIQNFYLTPLQCPNCGASLEAEEASAVFYCLTCRLGSELRGGKFLSYPLHFASAPQSSPVGAIHELPLLYLPFWVIEAQIEIMTRQYARTGPEADYWRNFYKQLKSSLPGANITPAQEGPQTLHLFVPAFATTNIAAYTTNLGVALTQAQPAFEKGMPVPPRPCIYGSQEALVLAEIIFMALETRETANLLRLEFNLKPLCQEIWTLPFYQDKEFLVEPKTGAKMLAAGLEAIKE